MQRTLKLIFQRGDVIKVGAKFGASAKHTNTVTHTLAKTISSKEFGQVNIDFTRPIWKNYTIVGEYLKYFPNEIQLSNACFVNIEPRIK